MLMSASLTSFLGAPVQIEDSQRFGKRLGVVAAAGMVKYGRHTAKGLNIEAQVRIPPLSKPALAAAAAKASTGHRTWN